MGTLPAVRLVEPLAGDWQRFDWRGGYFDCARRPHTELVEGVIRVPEVLLLATLRGGADRLHVQGDCGHRFIGSDHVGAISLVPAGRERRLRLEGVEASWASLALDPQLFARTPDALPCLTNVQDDFLFGLLRELERLLRSDRTLDETYCDAMASAAACYLDRRYTRMARSTRKSNPGLTTRQVRLVAEHVEALLDGALRVAELAALLELSEGHFHRAFHRTVGTTPLEFINRQRVRRAARILRQRELSSAELALRVGFTSPGYFARTFRRLIGCSPTQYRSQQRAQRSASRGDPR